MQSFVSEKNLYERDLFQKNISEQAALLELMNGLTDSVYDVGKTVLACFDSGGKILLCGNGGSAAHSQHLAAEFTGRLLKERGPLPALSISTDISTITAIGNDYSFESIFARQVIAIGKPNDLLMCISTSGNSLNLVYAVEAARKLQLRSVALLGGDGGRLRQLCDHTIVVPSYNRARVQECHLLIGHTLCELVEFKQNCDPS